MDNDNYVTCPDCKTEFKLDMLYETGDVLVCPHCKLKLELEEIYPPEIVDAEYDDSEYEDEEDEEREEDTSEELETAAVIENDRKDSETDYKQDDI
jgi:DNA-directed RNA polymerase subunit RPC12/RpoP